MQLPEIGIDIRNQYPLVFGGGDLSDWTPAELGTELLCWLRPDELNPPNRLINTHLLNTWARSALNVPVLKGSETDPLGGSGAVFEISSNVTNTAAQVNQDAPGWSGGSEEMVSVSTIRPLLGVLLVTKCDLRWGMELRPGVFR